MSRTVLLAFSILLFFFTRPAHAQDVSGNVPDATGTPVVSACVHMDVRLRDALHDLAAKHVPHKGYKLLAWVRGRAERHLPITFHGTGAQHDTCP